jgi:hypothetical protein
MKTLKFGAKQTETLLCVAADTASRQHELETCTVCGRPGKMLKNGRGMWHLSTLN